MLKWLWLSLLVIGVDQGSKIWAESALEFNAPVPVFPGFNLTLLYNTGAAFSFLAGESGWQRWFFVVLASVVSVAIVIWMLRLKRSEIWSAVALGLILGGALGNVIDRIRLGHVVDFIQVYYQQYYWPAFNVADSAITLGAGILLVQALFEPKRSFAKNDIK